MTIVLCFFLNFAWVWSLAKEPRRIGGARVRQKASAVCSQIEMAEFCDLMALALESGSNFGRAFESACGALASSHGAAFARRVRTLVFCGNSVSQAMRDSAQQENFEIALELVSAMTLAANMGTGLAETARRLGQDLRSRASTTLEERAARVPVLMLFPLAVFILPVVCVLLTAGAVTEFLKTLS